MMGSTSAIALVWRTCFDRCRRWNVRACRAVRTMRKAQFCFGIFQEVPLFAGTHRKSGNNMVYLDLLDSVNREIGKDAIMKQHRKAREERHLAHRSKREET